MNELDLTFAALSDPTRRAILARLALGEASVGELAEPFAISMPAISRHLKVLENASLIVNERRGKHRFCRIQPETLARGAQWFDDYRHFWRGSFRRLDRHLKKGR